MRRRSQRSWKPGAQVLGVGRSSRCLDNTVGVWGQVEGRGSQNNLTVQFTADSRLGITEETQQGDSRGLRVHTKPSAVA